MYIYKCIIQIKSKMMSHSQNNKKNQHKQKKRKFPKTIEIYIDFETVHFLFFWVFFFITDVFIYCVWCLEVHVYILYVVEIIKNKLPALDVKKISYNCRQLKVFFLLLQIRSISPSFFKEKWKEYIRTFHLDFDFKNSLMPNLSLLFTCGLSKIS